MNMHKIFRSHLRATILLIIFSVSVITATAQFKKASLVASGLTCAMCTKAINNSLEELSFIQSVKSDIKNSSFNISFKPNAMVDIDRLKKAVEDAGFSVAKLKLSANFNNVVVKNDEHISINGSTFHFLNVKDQTLQGEKEITVVDKNFVTAKEFKKYAGATEMKCIQTGKAAACCSKEGLGENSRIYHVTI